MKKRIKADSVDELFEIVKAIQNGEEPEAYAKRKAAEAAAAEAEAKREAREAAKAKKKKRAASRTEETPSARDQDPGKEKASRMAQTNRKAASDSERRAEAASVRPKVQRDLAGTQAEIKKRSAGGNLVEEEDLAFERLLDEEPGEELQTSAKIIVDRLKGAGNFLKNGIQAGRSRINDLKADIFEEEEPEWEEETDHDNLSENKRQVTDGADVIDDQLSDAQRRSTVYSGKDEKGRLGGATGDMREIWPEERTTGQEHPVENQNIPAKTRSAEPKREPTEKYPAEPKREPTEKSPAEPKRVPTEARLAEPKRVTAEKHSRERVNTAMDSPHSAAEGIQKTMPPEPAAPVHGRLAETEKVPVGKTQRRYGAKSISEEAEKVGQRILHSLHMDTASTPVEDSDGTADPLPSKSEEKSIFRKTADKKTARKRSDRADIDMESIDLDTVQILDRLLDGAGGGQSATSQVSSAADADRRERETSIGQTAESAPKTATSTAEATASTEETIASTAEATASTEETIASTAETMAPTAEATASTAGATAPVAETTASTAEATVSAAGIAVTTAEAAALAVETSSHSGEKAASTSESAEPQSASQVKSAHTAEDNADSLTAASRTEESGVTSQQGKAGNAQAEAGDSSGKQVRTSRLSDFQETPHTPDIRSMLRQKLQELETKGFGQKQRTMAGIGALAALLVIILIVCTASGSIRRQAKQKYVTADDGLTILVENQPEEWCNSWELELKISVKSGTIASVEVDGTVYETDKRGRVTVTVGNNLTEVIVQTEESSLTAQIEIPKLDSDAPILSVEKSQGEITVTAADARSGVAGIWYAAVEDDDWLQLPIYQQYSDPIPYEEGKIYYFYASDQAGNISSPQVTNMIEAESISLSDTSLTLLEGATATLQLSVSPSNAYLTNVTWESSNTDVVTVTSSGLVTAVAEGGALIRVSADDVETITCAVTVESELTVTVSAIGDCTLGTYAGLTYTTNFNTYYSMYGASYFFENVRDILENDDVTFANLEGPLTDETTAVEKEFAFKGDPSYTSILLEGSIEVVTLANNHSSDYGSQSLVDTKENLTAAGIDYCIGDTIAYQEVSGVRIAFIGIYELASGMDCESQVRETIAEAQTEGAQVIIVAFHWGTEKSNTPDETQQALAHIAIDCGADLVVGHHPHVLQGIEKYNGKYIVYSLGNFCFGGNTNPSDKDTMIFRQTFTITSEGVAEDDAIEIIPCTISSTSSYNDYRPTPATGTDADAIMERINEYSAAFGDITYVASTGV